MARSAAPHAARAGRGPAPHRHETVPGPNVGARRQNSGMTDPRDLHRAEPVPGAATDERPALCGRCGEPYVRTWHHLRAVAGDSVTGHEAAAVVPAPHGTMRVAAVDDHHPCPARELP